MQTRLTHKRMLPLCLFRVRYSVQNIPKRIYKNFYCKFVYEKCTIYYKVETKKELFQSLSWFAFYGVEVDLVI